MPMDRSRVRKVINKHVRWLRWIFQLNDWSIDTSIETIKHETRAAECGVSPNYRKLNITFDADKIHSDKDAFDCLRHEIIHGMLADFDLLYKAMERVAPKSDMDILDVLYHNALERAVGNIERMIDNGLGFKGTKLIDRAKQVCKKNEG